MRYNRWHEQSSRRTLIFAGRDADRVENDEVSGDLARLLQLVGDCKSHKAAHGVTSDNVWTMRLDTMDESDVMVGHLLDCSEAVDGTKVLVTNSPHLIGHVGAETHGWCGHTSDVVDNEHARMDTLLLDREKLDQEVALGVFCGHDLLWS